MKEKAKEGLESLKKELRRVVLAGVGAAILAKEGAADLAKKWLAKGEKVEPDIRKALEKLGKKRDAAREKAGDGVRKVWDYLPIVTKKDFTELVKRIDALSVKIEMLRRKK